MSLYEIRSPCERFFFSTDNFTAHPSSDGYKIFVKNDTLYDYELIPSTKNGFYIPDLIYAASVYMAGVRGMPCGEYDVKIENSVKQIKLPLECDDICIKHNKCKLLCSELPYSDQNTSLNLAIIETDVGLYAALECDNARNFDTERVLPRITLRVRPSATLRALLVLSPLPKGYLMRSACFFDRMSVKTSDALAAAYLFLAARRGSDELAILYNGIWSRCAYDGSGISLRCIDDHVWRLISGGEGEVKSAFDG